MATVERISLEDRGQDFLEWYVRDGIVIDCQPCQGRMWVGTKLLYPHGPLKAGSTVYLVGPATGHMTNLNYGVAAIETLSAGDASVVEDCGRRWAAMKNIPASDLGL